MYSYLVVGTNIKDSDIENTFSDSYKIRDGAWAIGCDLDTCVAVSRALHMERMPDSKSGIVVKISEYYGFFNVGLWETIESWRAR